jgi:hypothetical protein
MPFPFFPGGLILALAVLGGAFVLFGLALRAMDRAAGFMRFSVASGLVAGMRQWAPAGEPPVGPPLAVATPPAGEPPPDAPAVEFEDLRESAIATLERVQRR